MGGKRKRLFQAFEVGRQKSNFRFLTEPSPFLTPVQFGFRIIAMMLDMFSGFSLMMAFTGAIFFNGVFLYRSLTILLENFGADIHRTDCFLFIITAVITSATVLGFYEIVLSVNISFYVGGKNDDLDNHIEHASRALLFTSILFYVPYFVILNTVARPLADDSLFKSICWLAFLPVWIITGTLLYEAVLRAARLLSALRNTK